MRCTFELFGMARHIAGVEEVEVELAPGATVQEALGALAKLQPKLVGRAISEDGQGLAPGHILNLDGRAFVQDLSMVLSEGQRLLLLPAAVGGGEQ